MPLEGFEFGVKESTCSCFRSFCLWSRGRWSWIRYSSAFCVVAYRESPCVFCCAFTSSLFLLFLQRPDVIVVSLGASWGLTHHSQLRAPGAFVLFVLFSLSALTIISCGFLDRCRELEEQCLLHFTHSSTSPRVPIVRTVWTLVDREDAQKRLHVLAKGAVQRYLTPPAESDRGRFAVGVACALGMPGIGKTRMLYEYLETLRKQCKGALSGYSVIAVDLIFTFNHSLSNAIQPFESTSVDALLGWRVLWTHFKREVSLEAFYECVPPPFTVLYVCVLPHAVLFQHSSCHRLVLSFAASALLSLRRIG